MSHYVVYNYKLRDGPIERSLRGRGVEGWVGLRTPRVLYTGLVRRVSARLAVAFLGLLR